VDSLGLEVAASDAHERRYLLHPGDNWSKAVRQANQARCSERYTMLSFFGASGGNFNPLPGGLEQVRWPGVDGLDRFKFRRAMFFYWGSR
jgi:hypothetical protein